MKVEQIRAELKEIRARVQYLIDEYNKLVKQCSHNFKDGRCTKCYIKYDHQ